MIGIDLKDDDYDEGGIDIGIGNGIVMISTGLKDGGGYDIDCYKIQISVSVLVKSIKAFVEKTLFFVTKVSRSF